MRRLSQILDGQLSFLKKNISVRQNNTLNWS